MKILIPKSVNSDSIKLFDKDGAAIDCSYTTNGNVVTATPVNYLQSSLNPYEVTATTFIKDVAGNALAADVSIEFRC
jgi:hypothetical protein